MGSEVEIQSSDAAAIVAPTSGMSPQVARVSKLAVTAFIIGLLACLTCFVGYVFGVVGNILAISALILIRRDAIRLRGKSLAMAAIALNSLAFFFGVVFTAGAAQLVKEAIRYVGPVEAIQKNDGEKAKTAFVQATVAELSPERFATFDKRVKEQLGTFQGVPSDLIELLKRVSNVIDRQSAAMNSLPAETTDGLFTLPTDFEKGRALLIVYFDSKDKTAEFSFGRIRNLGILKDGSTEIIWLVPLKDKTPAGHAHAASQEHARLTESVSEKAKIAEVVPPPTPPESESKKALAPN